MFNFWKLRKLGRLAILRILVKGFFRVWYRDGRVVRIRRGPLNGYKWVCNKNHQFWMPMGLYEKETSGWLEEKIMPESVFFDIGANAGYFTLLGSKSASKGYVIAFEPVPENVDIIEKHISANRIRNIRVESMAISDLSGEVEFAIEKENANSHIADINISHAKSSPRTLFKVKMMKLDNYVEETKLKPNVLKVDVEGAEMKVLNGAINTLKNERPICIISTHSEKLHSSCKIFFENLNYRVSNLEKFEHELICAPK